MFEGAERKVEEHPSPPRFLQSGGIDGRNSGEPWSEMDISDLTNELARGRIDGANNRFLCRDLDECAAEGAGAMDGRWASQRKAPPERGVVQAIRG